MQRYNCEITLSFFLFVFLNEEIERLYPSSLLKRYPCLKPVCETRVYLYVNCSVYHSWLTNSPRTLAPTFLVASTIWLLPLHCIDFFTKSICPLHRKLFAVHEPYSLVSCVPSRWRNQCNRGDCASDRESRGKDSSQLDSQLCFILSACNSCC